MTYLVTGDYHGNVSLTLEAFSPNEMADVLADQGYQPEVIDALLNTGQVFAKDGEHLRLQCRGAAEHSSNSMGCRHCGAYTDSPIHLNACNGGKCEIPVRTGIEKHWAEQDVKHIDYDARLTDDDRAFLWSQGVSLRADKREAL